MIYDANIIIIIVVVVVGLITGTTTAVCGSKFTKRQIARESLIVGGASTEGRRPVNRPYLYSDWGRWVIYLRLIYLWVIYLCLACFVVERRHQLLPMLPADREAQNVDRTSSKHSHYIFINRSWSTLFHETLKTMMVMIKHTCIARSGRTCCGLTHNTCTRLQLSFMWTANINPAINVSM